MTDATRAGDGEQTEPMATRWQPIAVLAALATPPVALAILVWPSHAAAGGGGGGGSDDEIQATLGPGESADGTVSGTFSSDYEILAEGSGVLRISVVGNGLDSTLTLVDPDSGNDLDFNDDTNGLDPQLLVELEDGESVIAEVRSLNGEPGAFVISVDVDDGESSGGSGGGGGPPTTAVVIID